MSYHNNPTDVREEARGKWAGILETFGVSPVFLRNRHGPCPLCDGGAKADRFRFDNKEGRGSWFCNACGAGDGWDLLMAKTGWDFGKAAQEVSQILGLVKNEPVRPEMSEAQKKARIKEVWTSSQRVQRGDPVDLYLRSRGVGLDRYPPSMRFLESCWYERDIHLPAMVCAISAPTQRGEGINLHRTYLLPDGSGKADVKDQRKVMPGSIPPGSAIRLCDAAPRMGIAEGVETALAAYRLTGIPTWAARDTTYLKTWEPPQGVEEVVIFADNDHNGAGQLAAWTLYNRLMTRQRPLACEMQIARDMGKDWADYALQLEKAA